MPTSNKKSRKHKQKDDTPSSRKSSLSTSQNIEPDTQHSIKSISKIEKIVEKVDKMANVTTTGNFYTDFGIFINELEADGKSIEIVDSCGYFKQPETPTLESSDSRRISSSAEKIQPEFLNLEKDKINYSTNFINKPTIICTPNITNPTTYYLRGFKLDAKTFEAFLRSVEVNNGKNITINVSKCKLTNEAFDIMIKLGNFSIIKNLVLIGNLATSNCNQGLLQQLLQTPVNFQNLFKTNLEQLTLKYWNLTDEWLDNCIPIIQLNNSLKYLSLDYNNFNRRDHVDKIIRVNRKLVCISMINIGKLDFKTENFNQIDEKPGTPSLGLRSVSNSKSENEQCEMIEMNKEEIREYKRANLYKSETEDNKTIPGIFLSKDIERRDYKIYFPSNTVFKQLVY